MDPLSLDRSADQASNPGALQTQPVRKVVSPNPQLSLAGTPMVNAAGGSPAPAAPTTTPPPLPTEYPSAPSTTGQPQNRLQLAQNAFDTFARSTAPQYTADLREATQKAAGSGQIGSGGLRTTYGNLANQRALALDTQRDNLINAATTATIGDQQAGRGLDISQQNADTSRIGTTGNLDVAKGSLGLEREKAATVKDQSQQSLDLAKKTADIEAQFKAGTMTLAQKDQALRELQNQQQYGMEGQRLDLAREGQAANIANQQGQLQLAKDQLAQTGAQFGLSLAQQKELATLADKTQNRQLDISGAQGQNALLLELARIMGSKDTNLDPNFLASVAKALGINTPSAGAAPSSAAPASSSTVPASWQDGYDDLPPELQGMVRRYLPKPEPVAGAGYQVAS